MRERIVVRIGSSWFVIVLALAPLACSSGEDSGVPPQAAEATEVVPLPKLPEGEVTAEVFEELNAEEIWRLGVVRFGWDKAGPPEGTTKQEMIRGFLADEPFKDFIDTGYVELDAPIGYTEDGR